MNAWKKDENQFYHDRKSALHYVDRYSCCSIMWTVTDCEKSSMYSNSANGKDRNASFYGSRNLARQERKEEDAQDYRDGHQQLVLVFDKFIRFHGRLV